MTTPAEGREGDSVRLVLGGADEEGKGNSASATMGAGIACGKEKHPWQTPLLGAAARDEDGSK